VLGRTCLVVPPDFAATAPTSCPTTAPAGEAFTSYSGNLTTVNDEIGNQRTSQTDGLGRLTAVWEAPNRTGYNFETQYQYDALSNMICAVQKGTDTTAFTTCAAASATWRPRSFIYDSLSRLTSATNPESGTISYAYDLNSNLSSKVAPRAGQTGSGQTTTSYFYDVLNRLYEKSYANPAAPVVIYGYDGVAPTGCVAVLPPTITSPTNLIGERSSMCAQYSASSWSFDQLGRPLIESRTNKGSATTNYVVNNTYYKDGSQKTLTYPSGDIVTYTVSAAGRFTQLSDSGNSYVGYSGNTATYAPPGSLATMTNGHTGTFAGIVTSNTFNDRMQPVLLSTSVSSTAIISLCYDFHLGVAVSSAPCSFGAYTSGNNSNVFQVLNNIDSTRSTTFQYDYLNRLSQANTINTTSANCWGETYTIDPWGNLTNRAAASGMGGSCTTELLNDAPATAKNQLNGPLYDAAGNVTNDGNGNLPTYSAENRIATVAGVTYQYDADGTRIEKSSGTMYWPGPGGEILTETTLAGTINEEYVYFDGARIARVDRPSGTVHYYFSDKLGSASVIASSSGTVQEQYFSYPYGGMKSSIGSDPNHFKFTGKERDTESNLDEFGARYYASSTGRFMTPDWAARATSVPYAVFGDPQSLNLYTYVENAPVNRVDADGHTIARQAPADDDITTIMWDTKVDDEAENGNGTTTLAQDTVTVEQVKGQGANVFDHAAISVNGQQAVGLEQKTDSGTAAVEDKTTPGAVKAVDPKREVKDKAVIQVTPEQAAKIQKFLDNSKQNPPNYNLYRSNCAQFCESALRAGGVKNVPNDVLPHRLVEDLKGSPSIVDYIRMVPIPSIY
jgi:RHS repeat-associated protein